MSTVQDGRSRPRREPTSDAARSSSDDRDAGRPQGPAATPPSVPDGPLPRAGVFVGRHEELASLPALVARHRVVTLVGPPGVGKTRLSLELARRLPADVRPPSFVDLTVVAEPGGVAKAVALALDVREESARTLVDTLAAHIGENQIVLVVDNCEHVVEAAAATVAELVRRCPALRVVATSQERLRIEGERVWAVTPLSLPASAHPDKVCESEAVQLFCERALAVRADFALTPASAAAVAEICRHLDGVPLAIELAAALMGVSSPEVVAAALEERFALLRSGVRSGPARHRSLLAAIERSYELLEPAQQALLRRLSVFAGGAPAAGVRRVCATEREGLGDVLAHVARLVERSLVVVDASASDPRYVLLESIDRFAADKLAAAGETADCRDRHLAWCVALDCAAASAAAAGLAPEWLSVERQNLRAALEWAVAAGRPEAAVRLVGGYVVVCRRAGHYGEARQWVERVLSLPGDYDVGLRVHRLVDAASLAAVAGDFTAALGHAEEALARLGDDAPPTQRADVLSVAGFLSLFVRSPDDALDTLEAALRLARSGGDASSLAEALMASGRARMFVGQVARAQGRFGEALAVAAGAGERVVEADAHVGLGWAALTLGEYPAAGSHLDEALALAERVGANHVRAVGLAWAGELARRQGDHGGARVRFERALEVARSIETPYPSVRALVGLGWVAYAEGGLEEARRVGEEALGLARASANDYLIAPALEGLAAVAQAGGDAAEAQRLLGDALARARARGDPLSQAAAHDRLGRLARARGDLAAATTAHHEALGLRVGIGYRPGVADSLEALGGLAVAGGRVAAGVRLLGAAHGLRERHGYLPPPSGGQPGPEQADVEVARNTLSTQEVDQAWAEGAALEVGEAVAYARRGRGSQRRASMGWEALTTAECQVAELVGEGLTNTEIARRLFISPRTVNAHLRHVYAKVGVATRAALMREAQRR